MSYHHLVIALQSKLEEYINCDLSEVLERVKYAGSGSIKRKTVEVAPESPPSGEVRAQFAELSAKQELNLNSQRARDQIGSIIRALKFDLRQERALTAQVPGPSILENLSNPAYRQKFISGGQEDLPGSSSSRSESVASVGETYFQELINIIEPYVSAEEALTWEQVDEEIADNFKVLDNFREIIDDEPWLIKYCSRIIPIQKECETKLEEIRDIAVELSNVMKQNETYRITVEKRHSSLHTKDIISNIADSISNKVSLENSDWEIIVQILRNKTGISVIAPDTILSVDREKRVELD